MAVQQTFVAMTPDQWVSLCELRPARKALLIQSLGGVLILGINTNAPTITNEFGTMPAGIWSSIDNGAGPATWRLDAQNDAELCGQQWWGWLVASAVVPPTPTLIGIVQVGTTPVSNPVGTLAAGDRVALTAYSGNTSPTLPTVTSALNGVIAATQSIKVADGLGDSVWLATFNWVSSGGAETITVAGGSGDTVGAVLVAFAAGAADAHANAQSVGSSVSASVGPVAAGGEVLVASVIYNDLNTTLTWPAQVPEAGLTDVPFGTPDGTLWLIDTSWGWTASGVNAITVGVDQLSPGSQVAGIALQTFLAGGPPFGGAAPIVTVIESFDVPDQQTPEYITVQLPTLSPEALERLKELQAKILAESHQ